MAAKTPKPVRVPARESAHDPVVTWVWVMYALVLAMTVVTYWRLGRGTYHFDDAGPSGAFSRSVTYLDYPVSIAAIGLVWAVRRGVVAVVTTLLCAVAFLPGVVSQDDLRAHWVNAPAALGTLLAVTVTLTASADPTRRPLGRWRWSALGLLALLSVPYLFAAAGLYGDHVPLLGHLIRASQPSPDEPGLPSVHRGLHEGLFGAQLAATAVALASRRLPRALGLYLALMLTYGTWICVGDLWHEQVVKRGWTDLRVPNVLQPGLTVAWGVLLAVTLVVYLVIFRHGPDHQVGTARQGDPGASQV